MPRLDIGADEIAGRLREASGVASAPALTPTQIDAILDRLFTNGQGERADRLVLAQDLATPAPKYKDLGGWGRAAVRHILEEMVSVNPENGTIPPLTVLSQVIGSDLWPVIMARGGDRPRFLTPDEATAVVRALSAESGAAIEGVP